MKELLILIALAGVIVFLLTSLAVSIVVAMRMKEEDWDKIYREQSERLPWENYNE